jgi:hypothetical protein
MTRVALTAAMHLSTASLLRRDFVGSGAEGASMPTPSINAIKSSFSFFFFSGLLPSLHCGGGIIPCRALVAPIFHHCCARCFFGFPLLTEVECC